MFRVGVVGFVFFCSDMDVFVEEKSKEQILPRGETWSVHKFGGTCVGNWERIQNVAKIIVEDPSPHKVAVVSAMSKVTDMMYDLLNKAQSRDDSYVAALEMIRQKHHETAIALLDDDDDHHDLSNFLSVLESDIQNLQAMLRAIYIGVCNSF
jgi:aspartokinase/homoserine dehydrogenase 1